MIDGEEFLRKELGWKGGKGKRLSEIVELPGTKGLEDAEVISLIRDTTEGSRNNTIIRLASYLRWRRVPVGVTKALLRPVVDLWPGEPIGDVEFERTVNSAYKYEEFTELPKEASNVTVRARKSRRAGRRFL